jgi:hypothetical protein
MSVKHFHFENAPATARAGRGSPFAAPGGDRDSRLLWIFPVKAKML